MKLVLCILILIPTVLTATAQTELKTNAPIAVGETLSIKSARLGEEREIRVFLPRSYAGSGKNYPVVCALDGEGTGAVQATRRGQKIT